MNNGDRLLKTYMERKLVVGNTYFRKNKSINVIVLVKFQEIYHSLILHVG